MKLKNLKLEYALILSVVLSAISPAYAGTDIAVGNGKLVAVSSIERALFRGSNEGEGLPRAIFDENDIIQRNAQEFCKLKGFDSVESYDLEDFMGTTALGSVFQKSLNVGLDEHRDGTTSMLTLVGAFVAVSSLFLAEMDSFLWPGGFPVLASTGLALGGTTLAALKVDCMLAIKEVPALVKEKYSLKNGSFVFNSTIMPHKVFKKLVCRRSSFGIMVDNLVDKTSSEVKDALGKFSLGANSPVDDNGNTPLHWLIQQGRGDLIQPFLQVGADPRIKNKSNKTPLKLVSERLKGEPQNEGWKSVQLLLTKIKLRNDQLDEVEMNRNQEAKKESASSGKLAKVKSLYNKGLGSMRSLLSRLPGRSAAAPIIVPAHECPVCFNDMSIAIETISTVNSGLKELVVLNCGNGHAICTECKEIMSAAALQDANSKMKCPFCSELTD